MLNIIKILPILAIPIVSTAQEIYTIDKNTQLIELTGVIDENSSDKFLQSFFTTDSSKPLTIMINSPGGSIIHALKIVNSIESRKNITCVAESAASAAFLIMQFCPTRAVMNYSELMQHEAAVSLPQQQIPHLKSLFDHLLRMLDTIIEKQAKRLELTTEDFKAKVRSDWWLFGEDIVKNKAADKLIILNYSQDYMKPIKG